MDSAPSTAERHALIHSDLEADNDRLESPRDLVPTREIPLPKTAPHSSSGTRKEIRDSADDVMFLGMNMSIKPRWSQLLICGGGFFMGYLVNGLCEEYVYNRLRFSFGWYFSFLHSLYFLLFIYLSGFRPKNVQNPWRSYVQLSAVLAGSHGLTKGSLAYLNYPAQIMFKSTKVLPVMVVGAFVPGLRRTYSLLDYLSALLLVVGLIAFTLADAAVSPLFNELGVVMICGALLLDAFVGNFQEAIFTLNPATTQTEMLFCTTVVGLPFLFVPMLLTGELFTAWSRCLEHPFVYAVLLFEACWIFIGQMAVLSLVVLFGAAIAAMVTTARKAVTLLLSYLVFTKPLLGQHVLGLLLISSGVALKTWSDTQGKQKASSAKRLEEIKLEEQREEERLLEHAEVEMGEGESGGRPTQDNPRAQL